MALRASPDSNAPRSLANRIAPQVEDVPFPAHVARDQPITFEVRQDGFGTLGHRPADQAEIAWMVQQIEDFVALDELPGDAHLPEVGTELAPQRPLPFRVVGQAWRRAADANVRRPVELDRRGRRGRNFQQDQPPVGMPNRPEGKGDVGPQHLRQPEFERLPPVFRGRGLEPGSDHGVARPSRTPQTT